MADASCCQGTALSAERGIPRDTSAGLKVRLLFDIYGTHKTSIIRSWFVEPDRARVHVTPTCGSRRNLLNRWFAGLTNKRKQGAAFRGIKDLEKAVGDRINVHIETPKPIVMSQNY
jgi:hypothetical protein